MTTAFSYHRVSTNVQDTKEQVLGNRQYAQQNDITVLNEYGECGKRHHAHERPEVKKVWTSLRLEVHFAAMGGFFFADYCPVRV